MSGSRTALVRRVLLIEGNATDGDRIVAELASERYEARTSSSLASGLARLQAEVADVVLLDLELPDSAGLETLERFRRVEPEVPILVLAGTESPELESRIVRAGAQDCVHRGDLESRRLASMIELAIERHRLTADVERARTRAILTREVQLQLKDQILARVSHELRSPLSAIHALLSLMQGGHGGRLSSEHREYVDDALRSADQLDRLIADLLDSSRIALGRLEISASALRLRDLVESSVSSLRPAAESKGQDLEIDVGTGADYVRGDPLRLTQVLANLLDNAVRFAPPGGRIRVSIESEGACVRVSVDDSGPGVPAEQREAVFDSLHRLAARGPDETEGLGLGLHIAREIVMLHGGDIRVEDSALGGARFTFTLDAASTTPAGAES